MVLPFEVCEPEGDILTIHSHQSNNFRNLGVNTSTLATLNSRLNTRNRQTEKYWDVIVVGAGIAGKSCRIAVAHISGWRQLAKLIHKNRRTTRLT